MEFNREALIQGLKNQRAMEETPETFSTMAGADKTETGNLSRSRMAGPVGARALQLMNDPTYKSALDGWMDKFGLSPQGAQFNQAKMGTMPEQQPAVQPQQGQSQSQVQPAPAPEQKSEPQVNTQQK